MSRINFSATIAGKEFPIVIGWDRRLGQCFVSISDVNMDDEDYEDDKFDAILTASAQGMSRYLGPDDCKAILENASVIAPPGAYDLLKTHISMNAGNLIVSIDDEGNQTVLLDQDARERESQPA
jgi:hypothetical protein